MKFWCVPCAKKHFSKMKKVILCGHTGSVNRGCEAIVRSTAEILKKCEVKDISAFTFNESDDVKLNLLRDIMKDMNENMQIILDKIKEYDKIIIFRHFRPDGDAIGSQVGLKNILNFSSKSIDNNYRYDIIKTVRKELEL